MDNFQHRINFDINENVYLKNPMSSELGEKIISRSIDLIDQMGFDEFTFRKLAAAINTSEASVYRYFDGKHNLLAYLVLWHWTWMEYRLVLSIQNIDDPRKRLHNALKVLTERVEQDDYFQLIDEVRLNRIVIAESSKLYFSRKVDEDNRFGYFKVYKDMVARVSEIILEIQPDFAFPNMLVTTVVEGARHQHFFSEHLPRLTNVVEGKDTVFEFYLQLMEQQLSVTLKDFSE